MSDYIESIKQQTLFEEALRSNLKSQKDSNFIIKLFNNLDTMEEELLCYGVKI